MLLQTQRLLLRRFCLEDADDFYALAGDPRVGPAGGWPVCADRGEAAQVLQSYAGDVSIWAIQVRETNRMAGFIKLLPEENKGNFFAKRLSYALSAAYWGQGYMTEAVQRILSHAFAELQVEMVTAFHYPQNHRSKRVLEKCGFIYDGIIPQGARRYDGELFDAVCYYKMNPQADGFI